MTHLEAAKEALKKGEVLKASVEATEAIKENPSDYEAYLIRGQISMAFGDKKGATEDMKKVMSLAPADVLQQITGNFHN